MDSDSKQNFEIIFQGEQYRVLESGIYKVRLVDVKNGDGKFGKVFKPIFRVIKGRFQDCELNDLINQSPQARRNSPLWRLVKALTDVSYSDGQTTNLLDLIGRECFIDVLKKGKVNKIVEYIPIGDFKDIEQYAQKA